MEKCIIEYKTPSGFGNLYISSEDNFITGIWFKGSKDEKKHLEDFEFKENSALLKAKKWLDYYFLKKEPEFTLDYKISSLTPFRKIVLEEVSKIPFGHVLTYKDIADKVKKALNKEKMSSQAVGGAVGFNPICIYIPCHRVVGQNGKMIGYGGGINNKIALLKFESTC